MSYSRVLFIVSARLHWFPMVY